MSPYKSASLRSDVDKKERYRASERTLRTPQNRKTFFEPYSLRRRTPRVLRRKGGKSFFLRKKKKDTERPKGHSALRKIEKLF